MIIETIETLNQRLIDCYGLWTDGRARYRIVFSEDMIEKRWTWYSPEGFELSRPIVVELPKYRQWITPPCYVLEQLTEIPEGMETDLTERTSYEPVYSFRTSSGEPLTPIWPATVLIINQLLENIYQGQRSTERRYKDPREELVDPKIAKEVREQELNSMVESLFGNETDTGDALAYGDAIVVPKNYEKVN